MGNKKKHVSRPSGDKNVQGSGHGVSRKTSSSRHSRSESSQSQPGGRRGGGSSRGR